MMRSKSAAVRAAFNRAEFLRLTALSTGWLLTGGLGRASGEPRTSQPAAPGGDLAARIARVIEEYDRQGIHRTATAVDEASASWLAALATRAGATATLESFALDRVDVTSASITADGRRIEGLPLFDGTFTDAQGISGSIGAAASNPVIALVKLTAAGVQSEGQSIAELRRSTAIRAIVAVTDGASPGLSPTNAASFVTPYGVPVLQVSSEHGAWLDDLARRSAAVRFVAQATLTRATAHNVVATVAGRVPDLPPVVVMTPRSGWWQCAGERGGGLACWLETVRALAAAPAKRPLLFVASSGHELGHLGLDAFLHRRPALIKTAAAWIHLGANIGVAGGRVRLQASDDAIEAMADAALARANTPVEQHLPRGTVPGGEARNIHVGGGRYVSWLGSSTYFHSPSDRWPTSVDVPAVARFAQAVADVAATLARV